jgi:hypothetical protein
MFDTNKFKRSVKEWSRENPNGTLEELVDFCEELIPPAQFNNYGWLVEQSAGWYQHVLNTRRAHSAMDYSDQEDVA